MLELSEKLVDAMINIGTIHKEDKELYLYGGHLLIVTLANILTTICIGIFMGMFWESIMFMLTYIPIRIYAGGYHSKTQARCYMVSIFINGFAMIAIKWIIWHSMICYMLLIVSQIGIVALAPIDDNKKLLNENEKRIYRRNLYGLLCIINCIILICKVLSCLIIVNCMMVALGIALIMLIVGKFKNVYMKNLLKGGNKYD